MKEIKIVTNLSLLESIKMIEKWFKLLPSEVSGNEYQCYFENGEKVILSKEKINVFKGKRLSITFNYDNENLLIDLKEFVDWTVLTFDFDSLSLGLESHILNEIFSFYNSNENIINIIPDKNGNIDIEEVYGDNNFYPTILFKNLI